MWACTQTLFQRADLRPPTTTPSHCHWDLYVVCLACNVQSVALLVLFFALLLLWLTTFAEDGIARQPVSACSELELLLVISVAIRARRSDDKELQHNQGMVYDPVLWNPTFVV